MRCIASASRPLAKSFQFGEAAVTTEMTKLHQCVFFDGTSLHLLTLLVGKENAVVLDQTYMFKNLVVRNSRAFYNNNTVCFKSYPMDVRQELVDQAASLLLPPSHPVNIRDVRGSGHTDLTIEGQVTSVSNFNCPSIGRWTSKAISHRKTWFWDGGLNLLLP